MCQELVVVPKREELDVLKLKPLLSGEPVVLSIDDPRMLVKRRMPLPALFISPLSRYGLMYDGLLFSLPAYGSEVVTLAELRTIHLVRLGLSSRTSAVLVRALKSLFNTNKEVKSDGK